MGFVVACGLLDCCVVGGGLSVLLSGGVVPTLFGVRPILLGSLVFSLIMSI